MAYNIIVDDLFSSKAATSVGSGANSVGVNGSTGIGAPTNYNSPSAGAGWVDFSGNYWQIVTGEPSPDTVLGTNGHTNLAPNSGIAGALYRPSGENYENGYIRQWTPSEGASLGNACLVGRLSPSGGGGCYIALLFNAETGELFVGKIVAGTRTWLASGVTMTGTYPSSSQDYVFEMVLSQTNSTTTQITCNVYLTSNLNTAICTYTTSDTEATLQNVSGAWGLGSYSTNSATRVQIAVLATGGSLTSGSLAADTPAQGKTQANLLGSTALGGTAPISYQLHRSTNSGFTPTWGDATLVQSPAAGSLGALQDTGLTPGTTYYYILMAQDSETSPVTVSSNEVSITTYPANAVVVGFVGDSLTFGANSTAVGSNTVGGGGAPYPTNQAHDACTQFINLANTNVDGDNYIGFNMGVSGSTTGNWQPGQADYNTAYAVFEKAQVSSILIMLGTNDAKAGPVSSATYGSNMAAIIAGFEGIASVSQIWLNWQPKDLSGSYETAADGYLVELQSLANGNTVFMGDSSAHQTIADAEAAGRIMYTHGVQESRYRVN